MLTGLLLAAAAFGSALQITDRRVLLDQAKLLDAEVALAKSNKSYLYFDLSSNRVELRIQGVMLKTWDVADYSQWGRPLPSGSFKLEKKEALRTPKRKNITPVADKNKDEKNGGVDLEVLELKDMPGHFNFEFEKGITMRFKAVPHKLSMRLGNFFNSLGRLLTLPMKTILASLRKSNFTDIQLVLRNEIDAQGLYWAAEDGMSVLVLRK